MRKFVIKIVSFSLPLVVLGFLADYIISINLKKSQQFACGEYSVWNDLYDSNINTDMLIYGSSRAWVHIDPLLIEKELGLSAYNMGMDGQTFYTQYLRHREYLRFNKNPKYIIMSLDIFSMEKDSGLYNASQFLPYALFNQNIYRYTHTYAGGFDLYDCTVPLKRYQGQIGEIGLARKMMFGLLQEEPMRVKGYRAIDEEWNKDFENAKAQVDFLSVKNDSTVIQLFDAFLKECASKDIRVILVYSPVHVKGQQFVKNRNEVMELYEHFSRKYKFPFLNYLDAPICTDKTYFYNATHLNKEGAEKFTQMLANDLKSLVELNSLDNR